MLFRGYLPIMSGAAMADFLQAKGVHRWSLKTFLLTQAARLKKHAMEMATTAGRPYQYLGERTRKEDLARQIAERDGIGDGLVCVFALLELSRTFSVVWKERNSFVQSTRRKCLQIDLPQPSDEDVRCVLAQLVRKLHRARTPGVEEPVKKALAQTCRRQ
jgi:hypothetical protein